MLNAEARNHKDVRGVLSESRWLQSIPSHLQRAYRRQRQVDFDNLAVIGAPLLPLLYIVMVVLLGLLYLDELQGHDLRLWLGTEGISGALVVLGVSLVQVEAVRSRFNVWVPVLLALILLARVVAVMLAHSHELATGLMFCTLVVITVGCLALDLSALEVAAAVFPGTLLILLLSGTAPLEFWFGFLCFYGLMAVVCVVIRMLQENAHKKFFLQGVLLQQEEREITLLNERISMLASKDVMTGLANRRRFYDLLEGEWQRAVEQRTMVAVLIVDVDSFISYTGRHTRQQGDRLLLRVAGVIRNTIDRRTDTAARYADDEFALLLTEVNEVRAQAVANTIAAVLEHQKIVHGATTDLSYVSVSVGLALCQPQPGDDAQVLVDTAKAALKKAQTKGGNQVMMAEANFVEAAFFGGRKVAVGEIGAPVGVSGEE